MRISLIAVGQRMPGWVQQGFSEYSERLRSRMPLQLVEVPAVRRGSGDVARAIAEEGRRLLAAVRADHHVVVLDERGKARSSIEVSQWLGRRLNEGSDLDFLVGGADGFAPEVLQRADERWSLSSLTLPHALVRVVFAEQLYRAVTLLDGHPYHRE
ncbi:MAG TPA: 23S rRNA (pseudouridine(1915)-N(3))-methyltransferase RlmH [Steroidobacteraceae bacterium]|nr:23S rRNA (pseudouridine(1915)-N(3))-methyltransferase RlmH [Steroidobacteraceae bacterium]